MPGNTRTITAAQIIMASLAAATLLGAFYGFDFLRRTGSPGYSWSIFGESSMLLGLALIPNVLSVLAIYLVLKRLRSYGLAETEEHLGDISDFVREHLAKSSAEVEVHEGIEEFPWQEFFTTQGSIHVVANFASLPLRNARLALKSAFSRPGIEHTISLADPLNDALLDAIASSRTELVDISTKAAVKREICESLAQLIAAAPDGCVSDDSQPIPHITIRLLKRPAPFTLYWTASSAAFAGLEVFEDDHIKFPRIRFSDGAAIHLRAFAERYARSTHDNSRLPSCAELLTLAATVQSPNWKNQQSSRIKK